MALFAQNAATVSKPKDAPSAPDIAALFDAHAAFLVRVAERLTGSGAMAEDVVQEAFLIAHRRREELTTHRDLRGWLYRVTVNVVRTHRRTTARRRRFLARFTEHVADGPRPPTPDEDLERYDQAVRIRECVAALPMAQREVFVLYELEQLSGVEIARLLELPQNTVWSRLRLARGKFKRLYSARARGDREVRR